MGFEEHVNDVVGMDSGWELKETSIQSIKLEGEYNFLIRVRGSKEYENWIIFNPEEVMHFMPNSDSYEQAKTASKTSVCKLLRHLEKDRPHEETVYALYYDQVLQGLWR